MSPSRALTPCNEDFEALFEVALSREDMQSLPQERFGSGFGACGKLGRSVAQKERTAALGLVPLRKRSHCLKEPQKVGGGGGGVGASCQKGDCAKGVFLFG